MINFIFDKCEVILFCQTNSLHTESFSLIKYMTIKKA